MSDSATPWTAVHQAPVLLYHLEFGQTHVLLVNNAFLLSQSLPPPSPFAFNLSQHQVFSNESALRIRWSKYLEVQLQHQAFP